MRGYYYNFDSTLSLTNLREDSISYIIELLEVRTNDPDTIFVRYISHNHLLISFQHR